MEPSAADVAHPARLMLGFAGEAVPRGAVSKGQPGPWLRERTRPGLGSKDHHEPRGARAREGALSGEVGGGGCGRWGWGVQPAT